MFLGNIFCSVHIQSSGHADTGRSHRIALRSSLLAHVLRFGQGPQPVLTQLCLAVGVLALHMEAWHGSVVTDLVTSLTTPPEQATAKLPCLLELLLVQRLVAGDAPAEAGQMIRVTPAR